MSNAKRIVTGGMSVAVAALLLTALLLALAAPQQMVMAQAPLGTIGVPYTQNFNSLANSGTSNPWTNNTTLSGWYAAQQNGSLSTYRADNGSSNTGALYSYGSTGETERALGSVSSSTPGTIYYGVRLENNTGVAITSLDIAYTGEQWRNGGNTAQQKLAFAYQVGDNLTSLTTGNWTAVSTLDFTGPITGSTASALDGNAAANRVAISGTINVLIMPGQEIMLRWMDINDAGNDHGLAIDDLSVTPRTDVVLTASKAVTPTTDVPYQGVVTYTVALRNWGGISDTLLFTDTLPAEVDFSAWIEQPAGASVTGDEITWSGTLTASTALTFSFTAVHVGDYGDVVTNTATFSGTAQSGSASAVFTVEELTADVTFFYHDLEDVVHAGESVYLAGTFNGWTPALMNAAGNVYSLTVPGLTIGNAYNYKYIVHDTAAYQWDWLNTTNRTITVTSGLDTVDDYRNVIVGWANLQWPYTLQADAGQATDPVYGRVYISNVTNPTGEGRSIRAQVGYGDSTDPATWSWFPMTYNTDNGNNDEFMGVMTPTVGGVYSYTTRFDGNWGAGNPNAGWVYGDIDGYDPFGSGDPFELSQTGVLTSVLYDVAVSKTALVNEAVVHDGAGALVSYTLSIENRSTITPTSNITLTDVLPTGFEYVSDDSGVTPTGSGSGADPLTWVFTDTLQPGETLSFTLVLSATDAITATGRYTNTAAIQIAGGDWAPANDTASAGVTVYRVIPISQARGLPVGTLVAVEGTVTAEPGIFRDSGQSRKLYMQDDTGGVLVYLATGLNPVARHNRVRVVGTMGEYRTETEVLPLNAASVVDLGPDTPITPLPLATGAVDESVEGQLVRVSGYIVAKPYAYVLRINDGSGDVDIYRYINLGNTSDPNYIDFTPYVVGDYVVVTGTTRGYDYSGTVRREVLPRGPADVRELYPVTFVYHDLEDVVHTGEDVHLRGDFNGWGTSPITMTHDASYTVFTATVTLENPGTYAYKYYVAAAGDPGGWDLLNTNNRSVNIAAPQRVDDYRNVVVGWAILQWPPSITINLGQSTGNIYGRLYISNVTNPAGEGRGIRAQVGYGNSTDPATWTWFPMTYNTDDGNNDEFMGAFIPTASGVYSYAVRFDGNWGAGNPNAGWIYGDIDGYDPFGSGDPFELSQAGVLTVRTPDLSASSKTVAPTGQVLPGSLLTYTISLVNASGSGVTTATVHLTDTLPAEVTLLTATLPAGMTYEPGTHTLYWNGEVGVGKTVDLTFQVQLPPMASFSLGTHTFHNTVTVADGYGVVLTRHSPDTTVRVYGSYLPLVARRYP